MWEALKRIGSDESGTSDVEYILITAMVILPLCVALPWFIIRVNAAMFDRIDMVVNLPFP